MMTGQRRLCCCIGILLLAGGCVSSRSPSWQFSDNFVTYATYTLQLLDAESGEPLANVAIARVEEVPNPESLKSRLLYGNQKTVHTPQAITNARGEAGIQRRYRGQTLMFKDGPKEFYLNCEELSVYEVETMTGIHPYPGAMTIDEHEHVVVKIYRDKSKRSPSAHR